MESLQTPKAGRIRRGWQLTKSSWRVLTLDKELMTLPILSLVAAVATVIAILVIVILATVGISNATGHANFSSTAGWPFVILGSILYIALAVVGNFFSAALIFGATVRFKGGDPTVRGSLTGARRKLKPLVKFSLMMATVGLALQLLQDRLPFAGKIIAALGGVAWSIANLFAVPIIVLSEEDVRSFDATKGSVKIIRQVWGEGLVAQAGVGVIGFLSFTCYIVLLAILSIAGAFISIPSVVAGVLTVILVGGLLGLLLIFTTLGAIAKAALYYYATTGEAPDLFDRQLLQASMTAKKARRIFA